MRALLAATAFLLAAAPAGADRFVVLARGQANARVGASELRDLFLGRTRTWPGGRQVELAVPAPDTPEIAWLAETVFGLSPRELRTLLRQRVFAGEMPEPRTLLLAGLHRVRAPEPRRSLRGQRVARGYARGERRCLDPCRVAGSQPRAARRWPPG